MEWREAQSTRPLDRLRADQVLGAARAGAGAKFHQHRVGRAQCMCAPGDTSMAGKGKAQQQLPPCPEQSTWCSRARTSQRQNSARDVAALIPSRSASAEKAGLRKTKPLQGADSAARGQMPNAVRLRVGPEERRGALRGRTQREWGGGACLRGRQQALALHHTGAARQVHRGMGLPARPRGRTAALRHVCHGMGHQAPMPPCACVHRNKPRMSERVCIGKSHGFMSASIDQVLVSLRSVHAHMHMHFCAYLVHTCTASRHN